MNESTSTAFLTAESTCRNSVRNFPTQPSHQNQNYVKRSGIYYGNCQTNIYIHIYLYLSIYDIDELWFLVRYVIDVTPSVDSLTTFEHSDAESDVYPSLENHSTIKIKFPKKPDSLIAENDQGIIEKYDFIVTISKVCLFVALLQILYKKNYS